MLNEVDFYNFIIMKAVGLLLLLFLAMHVSGYTMAQTDTVERRCKLIQKAFVSKSGEETSVMEYYLSCNNGDAYIKLCEGRVEEKDLLSLVNQMVVAKLSVLEGEWDVCSPDEHVQSRIGPYVVLYDVQLFKEDDLIVSDKGLTDVHHIQSKVADSIGFQLLDLLKKIEKIDSNEFTGYFMPLSEYRVMAVDTSISAGMRQGMGAISEEQFKYRYVLVYQRLMGSIEANGIDPSKAKMKRFIVNEMDEGGVKGMEGILELSVKGKDYYIKVLAIHRNEVWNLVEFDRIMPDSK